MTRIQPGSGTFTASAEPAHDPELLRARALGALTTARERTALLTSCVADEELTAQHSPLMSPLVWDLAHIGNQEEQWLLRTVARREALRPEIDSVYDAFEHPRSERPTLPLLSPTEARGYAAKVRGRALDVLERAPLRGGPWLFSHNGSVQGWPGSVAGLVGTVEPEALLGMEARNDAAFVWALALRRLRAGTPLGQSLAETVVALDAAAPDSRLNLLLTDGAAIAATTWGDSLWYRTEPAPAGSGPASRAGARCGQTAPELGELASGGAVVVASEPYDDDPRWVEVPNRTLVTATRSGVRLTPIEHRAPLGGHPGSGGGGHPASSGAAPGPGPGAPHRSPSARPPPARPAARGAERLQPVAPGHGSAARRPAPAPVAAAQGVVTVSPFALTRTLPDDATAAALRADVSAGLTAESKWLPPKWFYDARGSELFEEITQLPEYYPTRAEREILAARAPAIAAATGARTLVELGSGSSEKTRLLLDALPDLAAYVPVDVSGSALELAGDALLAERSGLTVHALVADFQQVLALPKTPGPRLLVFLGGTIGNLLPAERTRFLAAVRALLAPGDALLLGTDLVKEEETLLAAYDDAAGVTAAFNKNVLSVLNRELGADFDPGAFTHVAHWDREREWIEMRLRATAALTVKIPAVDLAVSFAAGEELRTEVSAKFRRTGVDAELSAAGLDLRHWWTDGAERFALSLATPVAP